MADEQPPVTYEAITELADKIEATGTNYHEVIDNCWDAELLRQTAQTLLVRAMKKPGIEGLAALVRDEIITRRLQELKYRYPRGKPDGG